MPRIRLYISTGFAGCDHEDEIEYDDAEWAGMTEKEREDFLEQEAQTHLTNHIDYGAHVVSPE